MVSHGKKTNFGSPPSPLMLKIVTKYMAADDCRSGCLLISIASDYAWKHPDTGALLDLSGLIDLLNEEAKKLETEFGGTIRLMARGLDLRPRLPTEAQARKNKRKKAT